MSDNEIGGDYICGQEDETVRFLGRTYVIIRSFTMAGGGNYRAAWYPDNVSTPCYVGITRDGDEEVCVDEDGLELQIHKDGNHLRMALATERDGNWLQYLRE